MNKILLPLLLICYSTGIYSQGLSEKKLKEIVESYKSSIETALVIEDCGHVFDGPLYAAKQLENVFLDASLNFNSKERKVMASSIFYDVIRSKKIVKHHASKDSVLAIVQKITNQLVSKDVIYKLTIIDSKQVNAFTTMGGYLYITTGLLDFVDSYDELAFVIGHEVAHEIKLHTQRKVTKMLYSSSFFKLISIADFKKMVSSINSSLSAPFDQIDEYEADKYGLLLAKGAGYDVNRFGDFFKKFEKYEKRDLLTKLKSTHPFAKHRKNCISKYTN
ncbi:hypothetical protein FF125_07820 [Aureibaculum algae]|uniref:Peptidase M48 domain-containing protein n=1 Tax=Aureibaculum algae TaxID=2584122 RepID=A0A5B7TUM1_9FLAO|nr:hypothetical protein FF125_07820 [Aureibaculum algae]